MKDQFQEIIPPDGKAQAGGPRSDGAKQPAAEKNRSNRGIAYFTRRFIMLLILLAAVSVLAVAAHFILEHGGKTASQSHGAMVQRVQLEKDFLTLRLGVAETLSGSDIAQRKDTPRDLAVLAARLGGLQAADMRSVSAGRPEFAAVLERLQAKLRAWEDAAKRFADGDDAAGYDLLKGMDAAASDYALLFGETGKAADGYDSARPGAGYILLILALVLAVVVVGVMARKLLRKAGQADAALANLAQLARDLEAARRQAEAANRAKSSFLASMSHELRTPLNAVIGFADIMHQRLFGPLGNPRYEEYVASIQQSGQHLLSLINDILDMSRIEAGRFELHEERLEIDDVVRDCLALVDVQARGKGVTVRRGKRHDGVELWGDDRALRQMLLNLLSNGVKFTSQGGEVSIEYGTNPDGWFEIVVRDSGIGMNETEVNRAFEPFARSGNQMVRQQFTGTGLGLPITRRLIELHGGRIQVVSRLGEGTGVTLRFPPERVSKLGDFGAMLGSGKV